MDEEELKLACDSIMDFGGINIEQLYLTDEDIPQYVASVSMNSNTVTNNVETTVFSTNSLIVTNNLEYCNNKGDNVNGHEMLRDNFNVNIDGAINENNNTSTCKNEAFKGNRRYTKNLPLISFNMDNVDNDCILIEQYSESTISSSSITNEPIDNTNNMCNLVEFTNTHTSDQPNMSNNNNDNNVNNNNDNKSNINCIVNTSANEYNTSTTVIYSKKMTTPRKRMDKLMSIYRDNNNVVDAAVDDDDDDDDDDEHNATVIDTGVSTNNNREINENIIEDRTIPLLMDKLNTIQRIQECNSNNSVSFKRRHSYFTSASSLSSSDSTTSSSTTSSSSTSSTSNSTSSSATNTPKGSLTNSRNRSPCVSKHQSPNCSDTELSMNEQTNRMSNKLDLPCQVHSSDNGSLAYVNEHNSNDIIINSILKHKSTCFDNVNTPAKSNIIKCDSNTQSQVTHNSNINNNQLAEHKNTEFSNKFTYIEMKMVPFNDNILNQSCGKLGQRPQHPEDHHQNENANNDGGGSINIEHNLLIDTKNNTDNFNDNDICSASDKDLQNATSKEENETNNKESSANLYQLKQPFVIKTNASKIDIINVDVFHSSNVVTCGNDSGGSRACTNTWDGNSISNDNNQSNVMDIESTNMVETINDNNNNNHNNNKIQDVDVSIVETSSNMIAATDNVTINNTNNNVSNTNNTCSLITHNKEQLSRVDDNLDHTNGEDYDSHNEKVYFNNISSFSGTDDEKSNNEIEIEHNTLVKSDFCSKKPVESSKTFNKPALESTIIKSRKKKFNIKRFYKRHNTKLDDIRVNQLNSKKQYATSMSNLGKLPIERSELALLSSSSSSSLINVSKKSTTTTTSLCNSSCDSNAQYRNNKQRHYNDSLIFHSRDSDSPLASNRICNSNSDDAVESDVEEPNTKIRKRKFLKKTKPKKSKNIDCSDDDYYEINNIHENNAGSGSGKSINNNINNNSYNRCLPRHRKYNANNREEIKNAQQQFNKNNPTNVRVFGSATLTKQHNNIAKSSNNSVDHSDCSDFEESNAIKRLKKLKSNTRTHIMNNDILNLSTLPKEKVKQSARLFAYKKINIKSFVEREHTRNKPLKYINDLKLPCSINLTRMIYKPFVCTDSKQTVTFPNVEFFELDKSDVSITTDDASNDRSTKSIDALFDDSQLVYKYPKGYNLIPLKTVLKKYTTKYDLLIKPSEFGQVLQQLSLLNFNECVYRRHAVNNTTCDISTYAFVYGAIPIEMTEVVKYFVITALKTIAKIRQDIKQNNEQAIHKFQNSKRFYAFRDGELEAMAYLYWTISCGDLENWQSDLKRPKVKDLLKYCCMFLNPSGNLYKKITSVSDFDGNNDKLSAFAMLMIKLKMGDILSELRSEFLDGATNNIPNDTVFDEVVSKTIYSNTNDDKNENDKTINKGALAVNTSVEKFNHAIESWCYVLQLSHVHHYICPHTRLQMQRAALHLNEHLRIKLDDIKSRNNMYSNGYILNINQVSAILNEVIPNNSSFPLAIPPFEVRRALSNVVLIMCRALAKHLVATCISLQDPLINVNHIMGFIRFNRTIFAETSNEFYTTVIPVIMNCGLENSIKYNITFTINELLTSIPSLSVKFEMNTINYIFNMCCMAFKYIFQPFCAIESYQLYCRQAKIRSCQLIVDAIKSYFELPHFVDIKNDGLWYNCDDSDIEIRDSKGKVVGNQLFKVRNDDDDISSSDDSCEIDVTNSSVDDNDYLSSDLDKAYIDECLDELNMLKIDQLKHISHNQVSLSSTINKKRKFSEPILTESLVSGNFDSKHFKRNDDNKRYDNNYDDECNDDNDNGHYNINYDSSILNDIRMIKKCKKILKPKVCRSKTVDDRSIFNNTLQKCEKSIGNMTSNDNNSADETVKHNSNAYTTSNCNNNIGSTLNEKTIQNSNILKTSSSNLLNNYQNVTSINKKLKKIKYIISSESDSNNDDDVEMTTNKSNVTVEKSIVMSNVEQQDDNSVEEIKTIILPRVVNSSTADNVMDQQELPCINIDTRGLFNNDSKHDNGIDINVVCTSRAPKHGRLSIYDSDSGSRSDKSTCKIITTTASSIERCTNDKGRQLKIFNDFYRSNNELISRIKCVMCFKRTTSKSVYIQNDILVPCCLQCFNCLVRDYVSTDKEKQFNHLLIANRIRENRKQPVAFDLTTSEFITDHSGHYMRCVYNRLSPHFKSILKTQKSLVCKK